MSNQTISLDAYTKEELLRHILKQNVMLKENANQILELVNINNELYINGAKNTNNLRDQYENERNLYRQSLTIHFVLFVLFCCVAFWLAYIYIYDDITSQTS